MDIAAVVEYISLDERYSNGVTAGNSSNQQSGYSSEVTAIVP